MKQNIFIALITTLGLFACKPAEITLSPELNAEAMSVKGRNGLQIGQIIRYGEYRTDKVRRGWTGSYDVPFFLRFQGAKEKMSFTQFGPDGKLAQVACISKFQSKELPIVQDFFGIPLEYQNFFAGNISIATMNWDFIIHNPNGDFLREKASAGFVQNGSNRIDIQAIRGLKGQPDWMKKLTVFGHEFMINGKVVGAVLTVNRGKVWIDETLDANTRTVIAALATGLLLRTDVEGV
ncbi:MAG: hypothetical protein KA138_10940 [Saprospiraceae bacterium]|nr:hypothetical protein [Lewinellaceae bacterium]MBP6812028.1 hypothetical protein [Saprospiraceae bacterium]